MSTPPDTTVSQASATLHRMFVVIVILIALTCLVAIDGGSDPDESR